MANVNNYKNITVLSCIVYIIHIGTDKFYAIIRKNFRLKGGIFMKHILSALMENKPGVLRRLSGLFGRRGYNIDSIVASATENSEVTRMTIVVDGDDQIIDQVIKQLMKLQEIIEVENITNEPVVSRQLLIMKLKADMNTRKDILQLIEAFKARILDIKSDSIMIEATADDYVIDSMVETFKPYGVISMMKAGMVALKK